MFCVDFSPIGSAVLEKLEIKDYFRAKKVDDHKSIAKIEKQNARDNPWPTRMLCVNFSPICSAVLEKLEKRLFLREKGR